MPIYEYQCTACGHQLEAIQKFSDEPLKECPECHRPDLQKLVSTSAFHLKGGGWYVTDIRDKDKKKPESSTDKTTETKPSADKSDGSSSNSSGSAAV
jgi:putative FmdB family regulatory protein